MLTQKSPEECLALAAAYAGHIDLLLTDVIMPGLNGPEVAERLRETRADTRVLYMSGYSLLRTVREVLTARP